MIRSHTSDNLQLRPGPPREMFSVTDGRISMTATAGHWNRQGYLAPAVRRRGFFPGHTEERLTAIDGIRVVADARSVCACGTAPKCLVMFNRTYIVNLHAVLKKIDLMAPGSKLLLLNQAVWLDPSRRRRPRVGSPRRRSNLL